MMLHITDAQKHAIDSLTVLQVRHLPNLEAPDRSLRILLEDGSLVSLRRNYAEQVEFLLSDTRRVDRSWLHCDSSGIYFITMGGVCLPLILAPTSGAAMPALRRQSTTAWVDADGEGAGQPTAEAMHILLDQSSSMASTNDAVFEGARELVESLPDDARITISTFANTVLLGEQTSRAQALASVQTRRALGSTALYDAIVQAIDRELTGPAATTNTIVVVTDGCDNASRNDARRARHAVEQFHARDGHRILFLGANQDAVLSASVLGIPVERALTYEASSTHMRTAMRAASENAANYRASRRSDAFTHVHRQASVAQ